MAQHSAVESRSPWLAIKYGCCASSRDTTDAKDAAALRERKVTEMRICYDQPQPITQLRAIPVEQAPRPTTSHSMSRHVSQWVANSRDFASRASARSSAATLSRAWTSQSRSQSRARPSIGAPMDFRRCDGLEGLEGINSMVEDAPAPIRRRRSFRPLELSIYLPDGRLSPLPDFAEDEWNKLPAELEMPAQALIRDRDSRTNSITSNPSTLMIQRKPVGSASRRSSVQSNLSASRAASLVFPNEESTRQASVHSNLTTPRRIVSRIASPPPSRARSNTEPANLTSPRAGSLRRARTDVDDAIRELNTIVEERRADAYRSTNLTPAAINRIPVSPSHHVPAIAPTLRMHVRSETLSDIGSAFSVPLTGKPLPNTPLPPSSVPLSRASTRATTRPPSRANTLGGPLNSNPLTPTTPNSKFTRIGAWLKRSLPSSPTTSTAPKTPSEPFYQCSPALPAQASPRQSTTTLSSSHSINHTRQASDTTATVTLLSSYPSTPSLSRAASPDIEITAPDTPSSKNLDREVLKGNGKTRKVPAPLNLAKEKELEVEMALSTGRSLRSNGSGKLPPKSPNRDILRGMEIPVSPHTGMPMRASQVGVAF